MGTISYPHTGMGIVAGIIFFRGYRYGIELPGGYIPVAIPTSDNASTLGPSAKNYAPSYTIPPLA